MTANVRLHRNVGDPLISAISTNATEEGDFLAAVGDALQAELLNDGDQLPADLFGFVLSRSLPLIVEVCCKLRGYKANVAEHRVIVAGRVLPDDIVDALPSAPELMRQAAMRDVEQPF